MRQVQAAYGRIAGEHKVLREKSRGGECSRTGDHGGPP